ncbi:MAG: hypothetical protein LBS01_04085 [Prevotellaceae bacterium]|jgi:hypothetical protein|nr:hypothetical protein [Prevotellaceae bacterium]
MKKKLILLATFGFLFCAAQGQESYKKHELNAAAGFLNDVQLLSLTGDLLGNAFTLGYGMQPGSYHFLSPSIDYRYGFTGWFSLGGTFIFDTNSVLIYKNHTDPQTGRITPDKDGEFTEHTRYCYTIATEAVFKYMNKPMCRLYGFVGGGTTIFTVPTFNVVKTNAIFNFQITPLGVSFGKKIAAFIEVGYGYKGLVNAGISYRF